VAKPAKRSKPRRAEIQPKTKKGNTTMKSNPTKTDAADPNIASIAESLQSIAQALGEIRDVLKDVMPDLNGMHRPAIVRAVRTLDCGD
jgi:hypothetical protein